MVAQVIKLSSVTTANFQSRVTGPSAEVNNTSAQNIQADNARAKELAKQSAENIKVVSDAAKVLNNFANTIQTNLSFSVDEESGRSVITVTDKQTGDLIRQIPAKEILAVANIIREATASDIEKVGLLLEAQG